jgi:arsenite oxidase small subunit
MVNTVPTETTEMRRSLLQAGLCASALACMPTGAGGSDQKLKTLHPSKLVDRLGQPIKASALNSTAPLVFNYPYVATPVFLICLTQPPAASASNPDTRYSALPGAGPQKNLVAFSAICSHRLMYPTPQISFINVRRGLSGEPSQVIHCCGDNSRYDPARGASVISGPAPKALAMVGLHWNPKDDSLDAIGIFGEDMFDRFFTKYALRLEMELGRRARKLTGPTTKASPPSGYSKQWQTCQV